MGFTSLWRKCCHFSFLALSTDTPQETAYKERAFVMCLIMMVLAMSSFYFSINTEDGYNYIVSFGSFFALSVTILYIIITKTVTPVLLEALNYVLMGVILLSDTIVSTKGQAPRWPIVVVLLDLCLVNELPRRVTQISLVVFCVWQTGTAVMMTENWLLPALGPEQFHVCDCDDPPCRMSAPWLFRFQDVLIMMVDFYLTRGFAMEVAKEKARMQAAIDTAEEVARCLGSFDLEAAELLLLTDESVASSTTESDTAPRLPPGLTCAMLLLLTNLKMYRPFLPASCFPVDALAISESDEEADPEEATESQQSTDSVASVQNQMIPVVPFLPAMAAGLVAKKCSLVTINMQGSLETLVQDKDLFADNFAFTLENIVTQTELSRGLVDYFCGDRVFASFGTLRRCAQHATSSVTAIKEFTLRCQERYPHPILLNSGVVTGRAWCGTVGCVDMKRFRVIGSLTVMLGAMERIGRMLGVHMVSDAATQMDATIHHELRRVPRAVSCHHSCASLFTGNTVAYQVLPTAERHTLGSASKQSGPQEWMYEYDRVHSWEAYDKAVTHLLHTGSVENARRQLADTAPAEDIDAFVSSVSQTYRPEPLHLYL